MNKKLLSLLLFVFTVNIFSQTSAPEEDTQFWHETNVTFSPCKEANCGVEFLEKFSGFVVGTFRVGRNVSHPVDERIGGGVEMKFNKYFTFSPWYLYRAAQPYEGRKEYEHRIRLDATIDFENSSDEKKKNINNNRVWKNLSVKNRNRFEFRIRNSQDDSVRYRNKTTLKVPILAITNTVNKEASNVNTTNEEKSNANKASEKTVTFSPFIANEPFYDFSAKAWTRNEFSAGLSIEFEGNFLGKAKKKITTDFFYLIQSNRGTSFKQVNVFGAYLKIDLSKGAKKKKSENE